MTINISQRLSPKSLQVLREIDKLDKIGIDGVCAMLGHGLRDASGAFNPGVGLDPLQVGMVRIYLEPSAKGAAYDQVSALESKMRSICRLRSRADMMIALEESIVNVATGETAWDRLIAMPTNADETWSEGRRPANIAWTLDDMIEHIAAQRMEDSP